MRLILYIFPVLTGKMQTHSELLSLVCVILVLYRFQGSVLCSCGAPRESACLYYHRSKEKSTPFCNFFRFFTLLFGFSNHKCHSPRFSSSITERYRSPQRPSFPNKGRPALRRPSSDQNSSFTQFQPGMHLHCASSIISRLASTSRTNCSVVIAPFSQRSRTYSMTRTPSEVSCSTLPLRMYIDGAITFT